MGSQLPVLDEKVALLRAMRPAVRVLLLDEPTSGLDPSAVSQVEALLRAHLARGGGLLLVTHDARQATRLAQRHFFIEDGQLRPHDLSSPNPGAAS